MEKKKLWSKLPKKDKKHLRSMSIFTKWQFEEQIKHMKKHCKEQPDYPMGICWECRTIADKLGLWNFQED